MTASPEGLGLDVLDVLAALVRTSAEGIALLDGGLRIVYANRSACHLLGRPLDRLLGRANLTFIDKRSRQRCRTLLAGIRDGATPQGTVVVVQPDGSERELEMTAAQLKPGGRRRLVAVVLRDLGEHQGWAMEGAAPAQAAGLADRAAMAVASARLVAAAREEVALEERRRLARELHPSISHAFRMIELEARTALDRIECDPDRGGRIDRVLELARAGQAETRALIDRLRPESLSAAGPGVS